MMELLRGRSRWSTLLFLLTLASVAATETLPRQVLLLYSYEREFAPHVAFAKQFLPELSRTSTEPIDFIEVSLQPVRVSRSAPDDSMMNHVRAMLAGRQPDLVVPIGGPATAFAQRNRQQLFPGAPMLLAGVDRRFVQNGALSPNDTAVTVDHDPKRVVENILRVLPDKKTVFVVVGASHLEEVWLHEMKGAFRQFEGQLTFSWANELSFADMLTRCANLPPHSAIFYAILSLDAAGVPHVEERALAELRAVANAPIFGLRSSQLGLGIVGGPLLSMEDLSRNSVTVARRLLNGESARAINTPTQLLAAPVFDGRELRRWNIDEQGLPPRSQVMFREPTLWQRYKGSIVMVAGIQVMLVVALVASLARRRTDRTRRESEGRFRLLSSAAPVMMWIAGPDKLRTDVNRPWLDFIGQSIAAVLGTGWTNSVHPGDLSRCLETYRNAFDRREAFRMEYRLRRHDGEYRWILDTGAPRFLEDGSFEGYIGSAIDVTDLKLARLALSSLSQRLMQAHEHERAWVARELQDDLCQRMIVLTTQLHCLTEVAVGAREEEMRGRVEELSGQFTAIASEIFALSDQLHSSSLERLGLAAATRIFCKELIPEHQVTIAVDDTGIPIDVPNDIALTLFRVMQEAVRNAVKHAAVRDVTVSLRGGNSEIQLDVADQGVGFDSEAVMRRHGLGLIGMRERLSLVHGECMIDSRPGGGTRIIARVPFALTIREAAEPPGHSA